MSMGWRMEVGLSFEDERFAYGMDPTIDHDGKHGE